MTRNNKRTLTNEEFDELLNQAIDEYINSDAGNIQKEYDLDTENIEINEDDLPKVHFSLKHRRRMKKMFREFRKAEKKDKKRSNSTN